MHAESPLTLFEASDFLKVAPATLVRWTREGLVRGFKTPGGQWRFIRADLLKVLETTKRRSS